jgi:hypothetical protein
MKRFTILFIVGCCFFSSVYGRLIPSMEKVYFNPMSKTMDLDMVPDATLSWVGAGFFTQYTLSNTGQNGVFEPPPGWEGYDGMFPLGFGAYNGRTGEFPKGTNQFYVWGAGLWIGAKSEQFDTPDDKSIIVDGKRISNVRVATTAYYSEMSSISKLWQSNQMINAINDGKLEENEGDFLFGQKNKAIEDYQDPWSFFVPQLGDYYLPPADTIFRLDYKRINTWRRQFLESNSGSLDSNLILLDPYRQDENGNIHGDIISDEDTYCVYGDYVEEYDGKFLWTRGYDVLGLGIRIEQRTYSWTTDDYLYIDYKITNMNDFPLDSVFVGYFMDNDVGYADDDLIGFDRSLNLGYSYDSDLQETGWPTSAGYVGCVFVETPVDSIGDPANGIPPAGNELNDWQIGLSGFQTWIRSDLGQSEGHPGDVDDDEVDHLKYFQLSLVDSFEVFETPQDVRQLGTSGPVIRLEPGETISTTIAIVAGTSLSDLKNNTLSAVQKHKSGYIGAEPPPSPALSVQPAHEAIYLSWDSFPETVIDPFTGEIDFAGYRVYKSSTGLQDDWDLIADYDIAGDSSEWSGTMEYSVGVSNAIGNFIGPIGSGDINAISSIEEISDRFVESKYSIEFISDQIEVDGATVDTLRMVFYNITKEQLVQPNIAAMTQGLGYRTYAIFDSSSMRAQSGTLTDIDLYRSGYFIYLDGFYVRIMNGEYQDLDQDGVISETEIQQQSLAPQVGDIFTVNSFSAKDIGDQSGLNYTFLDDDDLIDGLTYYYSVTAYDRGDPATGIPELESSVYQNMTTVSPQHMPLELAGKPEISDAIHVGPSTSEFQKAILQFENLKGHSYNIKFYKSDPTIDQFEADYGLIFDSTETNIGIADQLSSIVLNEAYVETLAIGAYNDDDVIRKLGIVVPGSVTLTAGSNVLTDQENGTMQTVIGADTIIVFIDYANAIITIPLSEVELLGESSVSIQYQYNPTILVNTSDNEETGQLKPGVIYSVSTNTLAEDGSVDASDHGFIFRVTNPAMAIDSVFWSITTDRTSIFRIDVSPGQIDPYDYYITFYGENDSLDAPISAWSNLKERSGDTSFRSQKLPIKIHNRSLDEEITAFNTMRIIEKNFLWWILDEEAGANTKNSFNIITREAMADSSVSPSTFSVNFLPFDENVVGGHALSPPNSISSNLPDTLFINTSRPITTDDKFSFYTVNMLDKVQSASLDDIKVVPNPYIIRAIWDNNRFNQHIDFRHLPSECTIRIFNVAGEWIATLKKDGIVGKNEVKDEEGTLSWDLRNFEGLKVASGLYLYQLKGTLFGKSVTHEGKFAVVLGP